jgi:hypothetical protein
MEILYGYGDRVKTQFAMAMELSCMSISGKT